MNKIIAIVGRPNVGKSTLFNRLIKRNEAIVDSESGVTRDRHYSLSDWNGKVFTLIDTGGYVVGGDDNYEKEIDNQVMIAINECDKIIFVVDVNDGVTSMDIEISKLLRKTNKDIIVAVNKVDKTTMINESMEFFSLGFENVFGISAVNGSGTGDLLDKLVFDFEIEKLRRFKEYLESEPHAGEKLHVPTARLDFKKFVDEHDRRRGTNFVQTFPEFEEFYRNIA